MRMLYLIIKQMGVAASPAHAQRVSSAVLASLQLMHNGPSGLPTQPHNSLRKQAEVEWVWSGTTGELGSTCLSCCRLSVADLYTVIQARCLPRMSRAECNPEHVPPLARVQQPERQGCNSVFHHWQGCNNVQSMFQLQTVLNQIAVCSQQ